jgi:hypothetical protein
MYELPLFPLNTVLFPGMPIDLHIFEPRYLLMISRCLTAEQPFGVVLIRTGLEANGALAEPYSIGTTARISTVEHLADGRMNLTALGEERFEILSLDRSGPYLVGQVQAARPAANPAGTARNAPSDWLGGALFAPAETDIAGQVKPDSAPTAQRCAGDHVPGRGAAAGAGARKTTAPGRRQRGRSAKQTAALVPARMHADAQYGVRQT